MQSNGLHHLGRKPGCEAVRANVFVACVHTMISDVFAQVVEQMTVIMKQASGHQGWILAVARRQCRALKTVLLLRHMFPIGPMSTLTECGQDFRHDIAGIHTDWNRPDASGNQVTFRSQAAIL